jgi:hypothetical protein
VNFLKLPLRPGFDRVNGVYYAFDLGDFPVFAIDPGACGMTMDEAEVVTNEIAHAVNAYDDLIAQRKDLIAQRDVLVEVCETLVAKVLELDSAYNDGFEIELEGVRDALALVKGD